MDTNCSFLCEFKHKLHRKCVCVHKFYSKKVLSLIHEGSDEMDCLNCIMGNLGSSVFGEKPIKKGPNQNISVCSVSCIIQLLESTLISEVSLKTVKCSFNPQTHEEEQWK